MFAQLWPFIPVNKEGPGLVPLQKKKKAHPFHILIYYFQNSAISEV